MHELILMRHAHAENGQHRSGEDAARCLDARGRAEAAVAAQRLRALHLLPEAILASPAARTRETALIVARVLGFDQRHIQFEPRLYHASAEVILAAIRHCADDVQRLLLVGHNPGLSVLAQQFCTDDCGGLATAALCAIVPGQQSWTKLVPQTGSGRLLQ